MPLHVIDNQHQPWRPHKVLSLPLPLVWPRTSDRATGSPSSVTVNGHRFGYTWTRISRSGWGYFTVRLFLY